MSPRAQGKATGELLRCEFMARSRFPLRGQRKMSVARPDIGHGFIHVPKTGGSSMRQHPLVGARIGHVSVRDLRPRYPGLWWWGFVRNPYDRLLSLHSALCRNPRKHFPDDGAVPSLDAWLKRIEDAPAMRLRGFYRPMSDFLTGLDGKAWMHYVGRYEDLEEDFDYVCCVLSVLAGRRVDYPLPRINYSRHAAWQEVYSQETRERVARMYRRDFELWYPDSIP
ncbi:MAG: sulfotransferase family 2 domain-containing protein [Planctomycetota bacterium]